MYLDVETIRKLTHLGDRVSGGGENEAVENAKMGVSVCLKPRECGELLYDRRFSIKLKGAVYRSYLRPAILHGSEAW